MPINRSKSCSDCSDVSGIISQPNLEIYTFSHTYRNIKPEIMTSENSIAALEARVVAAERLAQRVSTRSMVNIVNKEYSPHY